MELLLWLARSPAKILGALCLALAVTLGFTIQETRILRGQLAAKPKIEYRERILVNERVVEIRTPSGEVRIETIRETATGREHREEPAPCPMPKRRFAGLGYGPNRYLEAYVGLEVGRFQVSAGAYNVGGQTGPKVQVGYKF